MVDSIVSQKNVRNHARRVSKAVATCETKATPRRGNPLRGGFEIRRGWETKVPQPALRGSVQ